MPDNSTEGNQDGHWIKKSNINDIPEPLTFEEQTLLEQVNSQFIAQLQADPQLRQEFLQFLKNEASKPDNKNFKLCSRQEGLQELNTWLNGSVSPGKVEIKGPSLFLEAPKWPHWNEIDLSKEYSLHFQWQHKSLPDRSYFMLVVDFLGLQRSLRVAFDLKTDYYKLKMFQSERNFIIVPNIEEFIQGLLTQNYKPTLIIQGIKPELLNIIDIDKAGFDAAKNFKK